MKKRHIVLLSVSLTFLVLGFILFAVRQSFTKGQYRDCAAELFAGETGDKFKQFSLYCYDNGYLTADAVMGIKESVENALTAESILPKNGYLLSASTEKSVNISRDNSSAEAIATVYFGDYFGLHAEFPVSGGFVDAGAVTTEYCVIDDLAAWRLFGSTDVCGLDMEINGNIYTVCAVLHADRENYSEYYGIKPRVYIIYDSSAMRGTQINFTSVEAVVADPITDFAKGVFEKAVSGFGEGFTENTDRFTPKRLWSTIKGFTELSVKNGEELPYYENISRIIEVKCAVVLAFEGVCFILSAVIFILLMFTVLVPASRRAKERRIAKKRHAIV